MANWPHCLQRRTSISTRTSVPFMVAGEYVLHPVFVNAFSNFPANAPLDAPAFWANLLSGREQSAADSAFFWLPPFAITTRVRCTSGVSARIFAVTLIRWRSILSQFRGSEVEMVSIRMPAAGAIAHHIKFFVHINKTLFRLLPPCFIG